MRQPAALCRARVVEQGGTRGENLGRIGDSERIQCRNLQLLLQHGFTARGVEVPVGPRLRSARQRVDQRMERIAPALGDQNL